MANGSATSKVKVFLLEALLFVEAVSDLTVLGALDGLTSARGDFFGPLTGGLLRSGFSSPLPFPFPRSLLRLNLSSDKPLRCLVPLLLLAELAEWVTDTVEDVATGILSSAFEDVDGEGIVVT